MAIFRPDIPPHIVALIRHLPPDIKRGVKQALRMLSRDPLAGIPLVRELEGLRKYGVRRFRIVYSIDGKRRQIRIYAIGHRKEVYEKLVEQIRGSKS